MAATSIDMVFDSPGDVQDKELDSWITLNLPHCMYVIRLKLPSFQV